MSHKRRLNELLTSLPEKKKLKTQTKDDLVYNYEGTSDNDEIEEFNNRKGYVQGPIDPIFGQRGAFPIVINVNNVKLGKVPDDVNEYLAQVRLEACQNSFKYSKDSEDYIYYKRATNTEDNTELNEYFVEKEFIDAYLKEYIKKRDEYNNYRMNLFELDAIELPKVAKDWKNFIWEVSCEKAYIAQIIEEDEYIKLIAYFAKWLSLHVDENFKEWVFAILEAVEDVLPQTAVSVVRQLGKKALRQLQQIQKEDPNSENIDTYKKLLTIIGVFYKQKDLISN